MPAPFPRARHGDRIARHPSGFPSFFRSRKPRIVTGDVWSFLRHLVAQRLAKAQERAGLAYIEQAFEFFEAASNPRARSRPLLYYYSFLNLVKVALLVERVPIPPRVVHGISDPKANARRKIRLEGQSVRVDALKADHSALFPEFVASLGGDARSARHIKVVDLLGQIPSVHRTFCHVTGCEPQFAPIKSVTVLRRDGLVWARLSLSRHDGDVTKSLGQAKKRRAFKQVLIQVAPDEQAGDEFWFETAALEGRTNGTDAAVRKLARSVRQAGVSPLLTSSGYRLYLSAMEPRRQLPPLAGPYAAMFYLGSITRYRPHDYDSIIHGGYSWVVGELISTQPAQFLYGLASWLAGVDVVKPYAITI